MAGVHQLVKYEFQPNSYPQYQHYCECTCGFATRMGTKEAAMSQFNSHQAVHGVAPTYVEQDAIEQKNEKIGRDSSVDAKNKNWNPFDKEQHSTNQDVTLTPTSTPGPSKLPRVGQSISPQVETTSPEREWKPAFSSKK